VYSDGVGHGVGGEVYVINTIVLLHSPPDFDAEGSRFVPASKIILLAEKS